MERKLRAGSAITPLEFDELTDEQLERLVPKRYRDEFPGKDGCADGYFYLHDAVVEQNRAAPTRAEEVMDLERRLLEMYADPALDTKPDLLARR